MVHQSQNNCQLPDVKVDSVNSAFCAVIDWSKWTPATNDAAARAPLHSADRSILKHPVHIPVMNKHTLDA
jgi:hypothetical protein